MSWNTSDGKVFLVSFTSHAPYFTIHQSLFTGHSKIWPEKYLFRSERNFTTFVRRGSTTWRWFGSYQRQALNRGLNLADLCTNFCYWKEISATKNRV